MITFLLFVSAVGHLENFSDEIQRCHQERIGGNKIELVFLEEGNL